EEAGIVLTDDRLFGYSTDGTIEADGMVEIKCPAACDKIGQAWSAPELIVAEYIDQINGGLWITGRKWCDLILYCPWLEPVGKEVFIYRVERDEEVIDALAADLWQFAQLVEQFEQVFRREAA